MPSDDATRSPRLQPKLFANQYFLASDPLHRMATESPRQSCGENSSRGVGFRRRLTDRPSLEDIPTAELLRPTRESKGNMKDASPRRASPREKKSKVASSSFWQRLHTEHKEEAKKQKAFRAAADANVAHGLPPGVGARLNISLHATSIEALRKTAASLVSASWVTLESRRAIADLLQALETVRTASITGGGSPIAGGTGGLREAAAEATRASLLDQKAPGTNLRHSLSEVDPGDLIRRGSAAAAARPGPVTTAALIAATNSAMGDGLGIRGTSPARSPPLSPPPAPPPAPKTPDPPPPRPCPPATPVSSSSSHSSF